MRLRNKLDTYIRIEKMIITRVNMIKNVLTNIKS